MSHLHRTVTPVLSEQAATQVTVHGAGEVSQWHIMEVPLGRLLLWRILVRVMSARLMLQGEAARALSRFPLEQVVR